MIQKHTLLLVAFVFSMGNFTMLGGVECDLWLSIRFLCPCPLLSHYLHDLVLGIFCSDFCCILLFSFFFLVFAYLRPFEQPLFCHVCYQHDINGVSTPSTVDMFGKGWGSCFYVTFLKLMLLMSECWCLYFVSLSHRKTLGLEWGCDDSVSLLCSSLMCFWTYPVV